MENLVKKMWNNIKQPVKFLSVVACFGLLPSSCKKDNKENVACKDMLYYAQNNIPLDGKDICGRDIDIYVVDIQIYKDATLTNEPGLEMYKMEWGVPLPQLKELYKDQKTHAEYIYFGETDQGGWIEVFDNEYGISISKDQPCFMVDKSGHLRIIGNADYYASNLAKYANYMARMQEKERLKIEQQKQNYYKKQNYWDARQKKIMIDNGIMPIEDDTIAVSIAGVDSIVADSADINKQPDIVLPNHHDVPFEQDSATVNIIDKESVIENKRNKSIVVKHDSGKYDNVKHSSSDSLIIFSTVNDSVGR